MSYNRMDVWPILSQAYQTDEAITKKWVLKQPTAPLLITISANREYYSLDNYSLKHVMNYRLGCVAEENDKIRVRAKARTRTVNIAPIDTANERVYSKVYTIYADEDFYPCIEMKAKLAVLEVGFSDGSKWSAKF